MAYDYLRVEQGDDGIVTVYIDDEENNNAVNFVMNRELAEEIARIDEDPAARALVLTGSGRIFCAGGNMQLHSNFLLIVAAGVNPIDECIRYVPNAASRHSDTDIGGKPFGPLDQPRLRPVDMHWQK